MRITNLVKSTKQELEFSIDQRSLNAVDLSNRVSPESTGDIQLVLISDMILGASSQVRNPTVSE